jgi:subtilisin family serine protease
MRERKRLLLVSLFLTMGLLLAASTGADNIIQGNFMPWSTTTVTTTMVPLKTMVRPSKDNPKLESSLNQLLEVGRSRGLAEARAFATSHAMVLQDDRVQVTIVTSEEAVGDVRGALKAVGGEYETRYRNLIQAMVPIGELEVLAQRSDIRLIREPRRPIPKPAIPPEPMVGSQTTRGVKASNASGWHAAGYTGMGVRIAVIDAGFGGYAALLGTDLPSSVNTYDWTGDGMGGDIHGTACAEIVYDMAYGATMDLHKIGNIVDLGNAVDQAITDGVDIISMSLGWLLDGPGDGTGDLANIVSSARSKGIFYATGAGNNAEHCWSGTYNDDGSGAHLWAPPQIINYFGPGDGSAYNISADFPILVYLHWDDWTVVDQDYDMELYYWDSSSWQFVTGSYNDQAGGYPEPVERILLYAPATGPYGVAVRRSSSTRDVCLRLIALPYGPTLDERVSQRSLIFPADSPDAISVGAVYVRCPYRLQRYSSQGPTFGPGGGCSGGSTKPDIASYVFVETSYHPFFAGTSAATPHVAGAAALVKEAYPSYTVGELQQYLEANAIDRGSPGKDNLYGSGRLYLRSFLTGVTLFLPDGREVIQSGSPYTIQWGAPPDAVRFTLKYSMDNGATWKLIDSGITDMSYDWPVPIPKNNKKKCLVKVIGYDASGRKVDADRSCSTFTIEVLAVTSPKGKEILTSGNICPIQWDTHVTKKDVATVKLLYTKNGGKTWDNINTLEGNPGSYDDWTVPDVPKTKRKCKVKVVLKDAKGNTVGSDTSNGYFTIEPAP